MSQRISPEVLNVLVASTISNNTLALPDIQLARPLYVAVDKVLKAFGGKWNRSKKVHVFDSCPEEKIEEAIQTGSYTNKKQLFQFFETPPKIAKLLVELADITPDQSVCEPSAGRGAILKHLEWKNFSPAITAVEIQPENVEFLNENGQHVVVEMDFLDYDIKHDVFVANPPFTKQQDIDHVNHMLDLTNEGGTVVSVMSASVLWRDNKKAVEFRQRVNDLGGEFIVLPDESFKESGTLVKTVVVRV